MGQGSGAAITQDNRLGGFNNRSGFSYGSRGWKYKSEEALTRSVSSEASFLSLWTATVCPCPPRVSLCACPGPNLLLL